MNNKVLHTLEFDKIINTLADFATCPGGKRACEELQPLDDIRKIRLLQTETSQMLTAEETEEMLIPWGLTRKFLSA